MFGRLIKIFVDHPKAANLLMVAMLVAGVMALRQIPVQLWPTYQFNWVLVQIAWPGASAADIDQEIVARVDAAVAGLNQRKSTRSVARRGVASVTVRFNEDADMQAALADVEAAVARIDGLPGTIEKPIVRRLEYHERVARLIVAGPLSAGAIRKIGLRIKDDLEKRGIGEIEVAGVREEEIAVELSATALRRLNLTAEEVAQAIDAALTDQPAGATDEVNPLQVRTAARSPEAQDIADLRIRSAPGDNVIRVKDVASVARQFVDHSVSTLHPTGRAVIVTVRRPINADAIKTYDRLVAYLDEVRPTLPPGAALHLYDVRADRLEKRIKLLAENGAGGLAIMLLILFLFLHCRVAFWVAAGVPVALMGTFVVMLLAGQSVNMVSLFAMVMVVGIIVDDAIVVGEHVAVLRRRGQSPSLAARNGAIKMLGPVIASTLTTVAAFLPILMVSDVFGSFVRTLPYVICAALVASLIECFLILPGHLRWALDREAPTEPAWRRRFQAGFDGFRDRLLLPLVRRAHRDRYFVIAIAALLVAACLALVQSGRVVYRFWLSPTPNVIYANLTMIEGTKRADTERALREVWSAMDRAMAELGGRPDQVVATFGRLGKHFGRNSPPAADNLGGIFLEIVDSDHRSVSVHAIARAWRKAFRAMPGVETLTISPRLTGPPGQDIDIRLVSSDVGALKNAAVELQNALAAIPGVDDIEDSMPYGGFEWVLDLTQRGRALGVSIAELGRSVRHALQGIEAHRFLEDGQPVTVNVRLAAAERTRRGIEELEVVQAGGNRAPLTSVADFRYDDMVNQIRREDGAVEIAVTAKTDYDQAYPRTVVADLQEHVLPRLTAKYRVGTRLKGRHEERSNAQRELLLASAVGLIGIYVILVWTFRSYSRPIAVLAIIPVGVGGAIFGHWVVGLPLTMNSLAAAIGLGGILVNDSIVLVFALNDRLGQGEGEPDALAGASGDRLRAVLLTSLTTIAGLTPLMFETSYQAQFLIPIATTIVFGLAFATVIVLVLVPCLIGIESDLKRLFGVRTSQPAGSTNS